MAQDEANYITLDEFLIYCESRQAYQGFVKGYGYAYIEYTTLDIYKYNTSGRAINIKPNFVKVQQIDRSLLSIMKSLQLSKEIVEKQLCILSDKTITLQTPSGDIPFPIKDTNICINFEESDNKLTISIDADNSNTSQSYHHKFEYDNQNDLIDTNLIWLTDICKQIYDFGLIEDNFNFSGNVEFTKSTWDNKLNATPLRTTSRHITSQKNSFPEYNNKTIDNALNCGQTSLNVINNIGDGFHSYAGKTRVGSQNLKLYKAKSFGHVFYGNQHIKTYSLSKIGENISSIAKHGNATLTIVNNTYQYANGIKIEDLCCGAIFGTIGEASGSIYGTLLGQTIGALFLGPAGYFGGAFIGGAIGGILGSYIGGYMSENFCIGNYHFQPITK